MAKTDHGGRSQGEDRQSADDLALRDPLQGHDRRRLHRAAARGGGDARHTRRLPPGDRQGVRPRRRRHFAAVQLSVPDGGGARGGDRLPLLLRLDARRAGHRRHPRRGARQSAAPRAALLRGEPAVRDRLADHRRHRGDRDGRRLDRLGRAAQHRARRRRDHLSVRAGAGARNLAGDRHPADRDSDRRARPARPQHLAQQPGPDRRPRHDRRRDAGRDEDRPGVRPGSSARAAGSATPSATHF